MAANAKERGNILWHALGKIAGKLSDRDKLPEGTHRVYLEITGQVGRGAKLELGPIEGELTVAGTQPTTQTGHADLVEVCALLLSKLPAATQARLLDELPRQFERAGHSLTVDPVLVKSVEAMLGRMRWSTASTKRGNVVFRPANLPATTPQTTKAK